MIDTLELTAIPPEDEALRAEVRDFLAQTLDGLEPDARARSWMGYDAEFSRRLAERGWLGLTLPREHGGSARGHFARFVLSEELLAAGAPVSAHWIADRQSAPLILKYGTPAQQAFYLPRICRAEAFFCIGMSEPGSGSDLASIRTRAEPAAGGWRLNGSKIWTTNAHRSHYMIALVRTSGTAEDRHQGLSQFIVDLSLPGVSVRPIEDLAGDAHFSEVFFDNVALPADAEGLDARALPERGLDVVSDLLGGGLRRPATQHLPVPVQQELAEVEAPALRFDVVVTSDVTGVVSRVEPVRDQGDGGDVEEHLAELLGEGLGGVEEVAHEAVPRRSLREGLTRGTGGAGSSRRAGSALELLLGRVGLTRGRSRGGGGLLLVEGLTRVGGLSHEDCSLPSELGTQAGYRVNDAL